MGTYLGQRDISGLNYKQLGELAKLSMREFETLVFMIDLESDTFQLEHGSDYFTQVNTESLLESYRKFRSMVPWYQRALEFISLDYEMRKFPMIFELDETNTMKSLNKRFASQSDVVYRYEDGQLFQVQWTFDFGKLIQQMDKHVKAMSKGLVHLKLEPTKERILLHNKNHFSKLIAEEFFDVADDSRLLAQLRKFSSNSADSILINPGEQFSLMEYFQSIGLPQTTITMAADSRDYEAPQTEGSIGLGKNSNQDLDNTSESEEINSLEVVQLDPALEIDKVPFDDYFGLSMVSSLLFRTFLKIDFQILRHSNHPYFMPEVPYFQPGLDAKIGPKDDLRVQNSSNQPVQFFLSLEDGQFKINAYACFSEYPASWLKEAYRNVEYADMITLLDLKLAKGEKKIIRKPISGLSVGISRLWKNAKGTVQRKLVWKTQYKSLEGVINVGEAGLNVFNPQAWEDLGLDEGYTLRNSN